MSGRHHTQESIEKMRIAYKGTCLSKEHKLKIGLGGLRRLFSEEHKRKISLAKKGKHHSEEAIETAPD